MRTLDEKSLLVLLQACAALAPEPLYPARFARQQDIDRDVLDAGLDELRRRGLVQFTEWVKDAGQGYALTEPGRQALATRRLPTGRAIATEASAPSNSTLSRYDRGEIVRRAVFAPSPARVTWILLAANVLYFAYGALYAEQNNLDVADYLQGKGQAASTVLLRLGALYPPLVFPEKFNLDLRPQFERIVLCMFLHVGLLHIGMNMYFLYGMGRQIEGMWGWHRFLAIYFVAGIVSSCVVLLFSLSQLNEHRLVAGASGSLFGIFMAMVVFFWFNREHLPERLIQDWSRNLAVNAFLLIAINFLPGISWQGHLGGAIGGLLAALLLQVQRFHPSAPIRWLALAGVPLIPIGFFVAVLWEAGWF
jgi:rhomboid protease GluP